MANYVLQGLQDPLEEAQEFPDELRFSCQYGVAVCLQYSPCGNYIAVGVLDGSLLIIDTDTLSILKRLVEHVAAIRAIEWSSDSKFIMTAGDDWQCCLWDVSKANLAKSIDAGAPVASLALAEGFKCIVTRSDTSPAIVDFDEGTTTPIVTTQQSQGKINSVTTHFIRTTSGERRGVAIFGTTKGYVHVTDLSGALVKTAKLCPAGIKELIAKGQTLAINALDRTIRTVVIPADPLDPQAQWVVDLKLFDSVTHPQWATATLSPNGRYVLACADDKSCDVYIWTTSFGVLVKTLKGIVVPLFEVAFHPITHTVAGLAGGTGVMYVWTKESQVDWSNLIPDFVDMPQLDDYEEREDDFDISTTADPEASGKLSAHIDIWTIDRPVTQTLMPVDLETPV